MNKSILMQNKPYIPYVLPFIALFVFIYLGPLLNISKGIIYPVQTIAIGVCLYYFRKAYLNEIRPQLDLPAILAGMFVFMIWVGIEGYYPAIGSSEFNPYEYGKESMIWVLMGFRLAGAVLVIPLMEELFWRSFAIRFLINDKFKDIPLGQFTWPSFIIVSIAFGFEHHRWLPGIIAGMVYAGVLYRTKNLFSPILSHAVTNLLLGIYVITTKQWTFW